MIVNHGKTVSSRDPSSIGAVILGFDANKARRSVKKPLLYNVLSKNTLLSLTEAKGNCTACGAAKAYRKIPKIIPRNISPPGGLYLEIALKYKVTQSKNGKFPSNYSASPMDFKSQISLHR